MVTLQPASQAYRPSNLFQPSPSSVATTLTLCLAYFAYCNPIPHRRGRILRAEDARRLAARVGACPIPGPLPLDPHLAFHLVWLVAADFLRLDPAGWLRPSPLVAWRLAAAPDDPFAPFLDQSHHDQWDAAVACLGLDGVVTSAWLGMARRAQERRPPESPAAPFALARWDGAAGGDWRLRIRPDGSPALLYELLALGRFEPPDLLYVSPLTLAAPHARDLGYERVRWLLESATGGGLDPQKQARLRDWLRRAGAYRLRGSILLTAHPHQLAELYAARRLRPYLVEQIGPRCALFDRAGLPALRRRLAALGYPLDAGPLVKETAHLPAGTVPPDVADLWLGLRVLAGLQRYVRLPGPSPAAGLDRLATALSPDETAGLDARADQLLAELHAVVQGRDAFFPARQAPPADLVDRLRAAVAEEQTVTLDYWPTGAADPRPHVVEPLRLEERDQLIYLTAYSYRAEATLTFRLDRVRAVES